MVNPQLNLAIFISGRGSNMANLIQACAENNFPAHIACVISNKPDADGLKIAQAANIKTHIIDHTIYTDKSDFESALLETLTPYNLDLICLAGFMRILSADFIENAPCDIINIHPSLLPKYKGLNTHQRAIDAGDTHAGCSVHYVSKDVDDGEIILQTPIEILKDDTAATLAKRLLPKEHAAYRQAILHITQKKLEK